MKIQLKRLLCVFLAAFCVFGISITANADNVVSRMMGDKNILSYKYSEKDNYWYTDKDDAWQHKFGYSAIYDKIAPFVGMEYDYVRVHFTYDDKDWMVQLWKGQYGPMFYGCETGVYTKPHSDKPDTIETFYSCAEENDRLEIQTNLYHYDITGKETREFSTPKEKTWWSTGFKPGHLLIEEPASELKQTGSITFDTPEMAVEFAKGLKECGFKVSDSEKVDVDSFYINDSTVEYSWRYISEAENTMPIKAAGAVAAVTVFFSVAATMLIFIIRLALLAAIVL